MTIGPPSAGSGDPLGFLRGGGELGARMRAIDWAATPLGPAAAWSPNVKVAVSLCLNSRFPILLWIGPDLRILYNDAYIPFLGENKHPAMLGAPGRTAWAEIWSTIGPMHAEAQAGRATWVEDFGMFFARQLPREEVYVTFSYSPILAADGAGVEGVFCACTETTERVLGERRLSTLRDLGGRSDGRGGVQASCADAIAVLADNPADVPFAAIYLLDGDAAAARRAAATGMADGHAAFPLHHPVAETRASGPWPLAQAARSGEPVLVADLPARVAAFASPLWPDLVPAALVLPLAMSGQLAPAGLLVIGLSPRRPFDAPYRDFLVLVAEQIATSVAHARAFADQRRQAEALKELDRAKSEFFANVSHEFRTPLTLMLGPLEEMLGPSAAATVPQDSRALARVAHRNGVRLLKLVNNLLEFSRIEARRAEATFAATDLADLTAELASNFRSACDRADLLLVVDVGSTPLPARVDRDMWEKIVLNLLSNAFKFTFAGSIEVRLSARDAQVELAVRDTGIGIPAADLPRIFDRFHRVQGRRSRSHEGTGIGLALVQELVRLHDGTITVESEPGRGTSFTVAVPRRIAGLATTADLAGDDILPPPPSPTGSGALAHAFAEEALPWLPAADEVATRGTPTARAAAARVLVVDDNADLRDYLTRLLTAEGWEVETARDGAAALASVRRRCPDLVLSDVMMPGIGGLGLASALRRVPAAIDLPILLLSARAGPEAQVAAFEAGADDYLVKPFAARELTARVRAHLMLAKLRRESTVRVHESEARLQAAVDLVGLALYSWDPIADTLVWDGRLREIWGLPPDAPIDVDTFFAGIHPDDRPRVEAAIAACKDPAGDGVYHLSYRVRGRDDGIERWISTYGRVEFVNGEPAAFQGAALDITERKRTEEQLRAVQAELSAELAAMSRLHGFGMRLTSGAPMPALLEDVLTDVMELQGADFGLVELFDDTTGALTPVARRGFGDKDAAALSRLDLGEASACALAERGEGRLVIVDVQTDARYADHRALAAAIGFRAVEATCLLERSSGALVGILSTYFREPRRPSERDLRLTDLYATQVAEVIASRLAEQRLRDSEGRFRQFAEYSADVLWIANTGTRAVEYLSPAYERIWGVAPGGVKRIEDWMETVHPDDRAAAAAALARVERGEVVMQEYRILRPDGGVRWIRDTAFPIANDRGRAPRVGGIAQDVTRHESSLVYVVGGEPSARRQSTALLQEGGFECRVFASAAAFLEVAPALLPGCVVLDIRAGDAAGLDTLAELKARRIRLPVIVLGPSAQVDMAVRAMKVGAVEFLQDEQAGSGLRAAAAAALAELREVEKHNKAVEVARVRINELTPRERQVLEGLLAGDTNKIIARRLDLSPRTVEVHRAHLMERLETRTLPELVLLATAVGLRPPRDAGPAAGN